MLQLILKTSLLLGGYLIVGVGLLTLLATCKFLIDIFPEILGAQFFGILVVLLGFKVLGAYDKIFPGRK